MNQYGGPPNIYGRRGPPPAHHSQYRQEPAPYDPNPPRSTGLLVGTVAAGLAAPAAYYFAPETVKTQIHAFGNRVVARGREVANHLELHGLDAPLKCRLKPGKTELFTLLNVTQDKTTGKTAYKFENNLNDFSDWRLVKVTVRGKEGIINEEIHDTNMSTDSAGKAIAGFIRWYNLSDDSISKLKAIPADKPFKIELTFRYIGNDILCRTKSVTIKSDWHQKLIGGRKRSFRNKKSKRRTLRKVR
jgi:hypothetical protein